MNNVVTMSIKDSFVQIRIKEDIKEDLRIAAELRGLSVSALLHSMIARVIREEKEREPKAFIRQNAVRESARKPVAVESDGVLDARTKTRTSTPNVSKRKKA